MVLKLSGEEGERSPLKILEENGNRESLLNRTQNVKAVESSCI